MLDNILVHLSINLVRRYTFLLVQNSVLNSDSFRMYETQTWTSVPEYFNVCSANLAASLSFLSSSPPNRMIDDFGMTDSRICRIRCVRSVVGTYGGRAMCGGT